MLLHSERGKFYCGGEIKGLNVPTREFPCKSPLEVRELLPSGNVTVICTYMHTHMDTVSYSLLESCCFLSLLFFDLIMILHILEVILPNCPVLCSTVLFYLP